MIKAARIIKRHDPSKSVNDPDVIIGRDFNGLLKPGFVYEITDYGLGEMIIREVGPSSDEGESKGNFSIWNQDLSTIICHNLQRVILTSSELINWINKRKNDKTT